MTLHCVTTTLVIAEVAITAFIWVAHDTRVKKKLIPLQQLWITKYLCESSCLSICRDVGKAWADLFCVCTQCTECVRHQCLLDAVNFVIFTTQHTRWCMWLGKTFWPVKIHNPSLKSYIGSHPNCPGSRSLVQTTQRGKSCWRCFSTARESFTISSLWKYITSTRPCTKSLFTVHEKLSTIIPSYSPQSAALSLSHTHTHTHKGLVLYGNDNLSDVHCQGEADKLWVSLFPCMISLVGSHDHEEPS